MTVKFGIYNFMLDSSNLQQSQYSVIVFRFCFHVEVLRHAKNSGDFWW